MVTLFCCRKNFVHENFAVTDNRENFLTAKISRYTVCATPPDVQYIIACDEFYQTFTCIATASDRFWVEYEACGWFCPELLCVCGG